MKKALKVALVLPAILLATACGKKEISKTSEIAVINIQQIIQDSPVVKQINEKFTAEIQPLQSEFRSKQESLQKELAKLGDPKLSPAEVSALKGKLIQKKQALMTEATTLRQTSEAKHNEALIDIYGKLDNSISGFNDARNKQLKLILKKAYVLYANDNLDITPNIKQSFDKNHTD